MKVIGNLTKDAIIRAAVSEGISVTQEIGSSVTFESAITSYVTVVYDSSNQKIVIAYRDQGNSNYGTAIVGTVSGSSISFGTPTVFESATVAYMSGAYDSNNNKVVFCFRGSSTYGRSVVGTVSGTSISFGSVATFESAAIEDTGTAYDANAQRIVVAYRDDGNTFRGTAAVGTVSGTSISFGTPVVYDTGPCVSNTAIYDSTNNKIVIAYQESSTGQAIVGTVSGTSISFGTAATFESGNCNYISGDYDSVNQKIVLAYQDSGNSSYGTAVVGTVSGTSISFGTPVVFNEGNSGYFSTTFDSGAGRILITGSDDSNSSKGEAYVGTVSGTSITFSDMVLFKDATADFISSAYDANSGRVVIGFRSPGNSNYGEAVVFKVGYSQATGGTIADGKAVIVNANGTVSSVSQTSVSEDLGSAVVYESGNSIQSLGVYDSNAQKVVIVYRDNDNSQQGTAVVGTVSGTSISFGSPVIFETGSTQSISVDYDSNAQKIIISYRDGGDVNKGKAIVGTVSGTSISFGTAVIFNTADTTTTSTVYDPDQQKVVIFYHDNGNNSYGTAIVGTVSGTSISFGTPVVFASEVSNSIHSTHDTSNDKVVVVHTEGLNGKATVGTVSGTSISFGSNTVFESASVSYIEIVYDSTNNKVVIVYTDNGNSSNGTAVVGTVSGTSISFGTPSVFNAANTTHIGLAYHATAQKFVVIYEDAGGSPVGEYRIGTVSGTSISFGSETTIDSNGADQSSVTYDPDAEKMVLAFRDGSTNAGTARVLAVPYDATNLTSENFVGFMKGAALDGTNGEILSSCSIARNQTSLTAGQTYFVSPTDGALSLTAGSPSVTAGTAISSTELIVKG